MKKRLSIIYLAVLCAACMPKEEYAPEGRELRVNIETLQGFGPSTKVYYGGAYGEHSEFEMGDYFGLFVFGADDSVLATNIKVYCSGLDNDGNTVWSIFKEGSSEDNTSNYPLSEVLGRGSQFFAYYPYNQSYDSISSIQDVQNVVNDFYSSLPSDQSGGYEEYDLLVASNVSGCEFGEVYLSGKAVSLTFAHTTALLRFLIPTGSQKYEYYFESGDFTPYLLCSAEGLDEYRFLFEPGGVLDFCLKYLFDGKLYRVDNSRCVKLWPVTTVAGHCYTPDDKSVKVPYSVGVDMGTSAMWASFNLGAENDLSATKDNIATLPGDWYMWGVNRTGLSFGSAPFNKYNTSFTSGVKPSELPLDYDYSGDPIYDAARTQWGGEWRTPSISEWEELFNACTYKIETRKITFTSKSTGNVLVLPYQGYKNSDLTSQADVGYYWSSTSNPSVIAKAISTIFRNYSSNPARHINADRYTGLPIRPVYSK